MYFSGLYTIVIPKKKQKKRKHTHSKNPDTHFFIFNKSIIYQNKYISQSFPFPIFLIFLTFLFTLFILLTPLITLDFYSFFLAQLVLVCF